MTQALHLHYSIAEVALVSVGNPVGAAHGHVLHGAGVHTTPDWSQVATAVELKQSQNNILISVPFCINNGAKCKRHLPLSAELQGERSPSVAGGVEGA